MAEQLLAKLRARNLVVQYRKDSLPYDIEQFITLAIEDAEKQARSEVLAAASHALVAFMRQRGTVVCEDDAREFLRQWPDLQPSASDLEELRQNEYLRGKADAFRLEGRVEQLKMMKGEDAGGMWFPDPGKPTVNDRIAQLEAELEAELEKARAEGKG